MPDPLEIFLTSPGLNSLLQKGYLILLKNWIFDNPFHKKLSVYQFLLDLCQNIWSSQVFTFCQFLIVDPVQQIESIFIEKKIISTNVWYRKSKVSLFQRPWCSSVKFSLRMISAFVPLRQMCNLWCTVKLGGVSKFLRGQAVKISLRFELLGCTYQIKTLTPDQNWTFF